MPIEIRMPSLVDSMIEGSIVAWRKREGDAVKAGEAIAEIEVDKTSVDLEAPENGILTSILFPAGSEKIPVGTIMALLEMKNDPDSASVPDPIVQQFAPVNGNHGQHEPSTLSRLNAINSLNEPLPSTHQVEVEASPLARSMATQARLDVSSIRGSGPSGRILLADVLNTLGFPHRSRSEPPLKEGAKPAKTATHTSDIYDEIPHSRIRQVIAQRLSESKRTIPHFYLEINCRIDDLLRLRSELQAAGADGIKLSLNDFAVRAAALALRKVPEANATWTDLAMRRYRRIDLAIAVATEAGLVAPVVRDADRKGLVELAAELRDLASRAREGRLRPDELNGGTFTISNLGMYGIDSLYAIVNPPQAGILGLGAAGPRPVVDNGSIVVATMMTCTLSADHRVLDGATGARFLSAFQSLIEHPASMIGSPSNDLRRDQMTRDADDLVMTDLPTQD